MGRSDLREKVSGGLWVLEEEGSWVGGWVGWWVKECVGGSVDGNVLVQEVRRKVELLVLDV